MTAEVIITNGVTIAVGHTVVVNCIPSAIGSASTGMICIFSCCFVVVISDLETSNYKAYLYIVARSPVYLGHQIFQAPKVESLM